MRGGYAGHVLRVDLDARTCTPVPLDPETARLYLGGAGTAARLYLDLIAAGPPPEPLSPENPLVIATGPLTGVKLDATARWTMASRSPLTGYWNDASVGGHFGAELKAAGFDALVVQGRASSPVYLHVEDGAAEIRDAADHWGLDVFDTTDRLTADLRGPSGRAGQVLAIGPAGEKLVRFAAVGTRKRHWAGRGGLGAVWGSKGLKAIHVRGTGTVAAAEPERLATLRAALKELYAEDLLIEALRAFGTIASIDLGTLTGDVPYQNWRTGAWAGVDALSATEYQERLLAGNATCYACGVRCKREVEVKDGPYAGLAGPGPEYETLCVFGPLCLNADLPSIAKANDLCNRYGLDTMSCGSTIAFALECMEQGLLPRDDPSGSTNEWGDAATVVALVEAIGCREGIGDLLAEGSAAVADRLGPEARALLSTVKGMEAPMHDARSAYGLALAYAVSPRGACHNASLQYPIEPGGMYVPDVPGLAGEIEERSEAGKAALNVATQDYGVFFAGCAVFCNLGGRPLSAAQAVEAVNAVTGAGYALDDLLAVGRRVWYLKRGLSNLMGARAEHDRLPPRLLAPLAEGPTAHEAPDLDRMLREFYELRDLDADGIPGRGVLEDLGLGDLAGLLHP